MKEEKIVQLKQGITTAFINQNISSNLAYKPQFVSNNYKEGRKVISSIEDELLSCEEFDISVAFITMGGITPLLQTLRELEQRGIPGKILTTDYLTFSDPKALRILANFTNIELKMFVTENAKEGFHTKGYIFKKEEMYRIIVGSSNMTLSALTTNREWNTKIVSTEQGEYTQNVVAEFEQLWSAQQSFSYDQFIDAYTNVYTKNKIIQKQKEIARQAEVSSLEVYRLQPNSMQVGFINNLRKIYEAGEDKALLISATGTGKTYASAFAARELEFKRVLFLVHRNQIAKQALKSYRKVFDGKVSMGMVTGKYQDYDADFVFATVQTLSKEDTLSRYKKEHWDLIIIDEAHRLNKKSGMFQNMGENQIKEIIHAARCSVFFIDESQRVTLSDIGSVEEIEKWAHFAGAEITHMELVSQFRCNGSDGYLAWLDNTLEIRETANWNMKDIDYDIQILDSPHEVRNIIVERNRLCNNRARILAGYCWNWLKEGQNDSSVHDIQIGDFEISWNLKNSNTFAIDETSINEAGCIHTSQGLEFDYVGVIIGDDLRYENGKVVTDFTKRARTDQSLKGIKTLSKENPEKARAVADEIIKNTYRTLMTRGMKGCYIYCTDERLAAYLRECLK